MTRQNRCRLSLPEILVNKLNNLPLVRRYWVGFSGGVDSIALLHALKQSTLESKIIALHINHSINDDADQWERFCQEFTEIHAIDFQSIKVNGNHPKGESPENWARKKRYEGFASVLAEKDMLLLAQHQDDQVETMLLQLLRGSGPRGMAAMPSISRFSTAWVARPLLEVTKQELIDYAGEHGLSWVEDPSNLDCKYDRNYLRHEILPLIKQRWPGYLKSIGRSAGLMGECSLLIDELAGHDLNFCTNPDGSLKLLALLELDEIRLKNVLRLWIRESGFNLPSAIKLKTVISDILHARTGAMPSATWKGAEIRRYQDTVYILKPLPEHNRYAEFSWDPDQAIQLAIGTLTVQRSIGGGLAENIVKNGSITVRFRLGGERFIKAGSTQTTSLKKFFQEKKVPPWERDRLPLIYINGNLAAISDLVVAEGFQARNDRPGLKICLQTNA